MYLPQTDSSRMTGSQLRALDAARAARTKEVETKTLAILHATGEIRDILNDHAADPHITALVSSLCSQYFVTGTVEPLTAVELAQVLIDIARASAELRVATVDEFAADIA